MKTAEDLLKEKGGHLITVPPDTTVEEVLKIMIDKHIAAMLVEKDGKIVGIWADRDLLRDVLRPGFNPKTSKIGDYMITALPTAPHTDTVYQLMDKFMGKKVRHLLITKNGEIIGMLSVGDVIVATLKEKDEELRKLKEEVSWDYYEDWQEWKKFRKK
ncbi:MAG: CBS domain-containing protein [Nitrospirae bacterium]|nr:MAG: CBS domain-containing protein [Nitrospirota bacterium]